MPRFMKIRGKAGVLVSDPHAIQAGIRRFVGQNFNHENAGKVKFAEAHEPVEQVVEWHVDLASAVKAGDLVQIGGEVIAASRDEAAKLLSSAAPKASAKAEKVNG